MKKIFFYNRPLVIIGLFSFIVICCGVFYFINKRIDQKNYAFVKQSAILLSSSKIRSVSTAITIEQRFQKYPFLAQEYRGFLINFYLSQGYEERALNLLDTPSYEIHLPIEKEILNLNNEITRLTLQKSLNEAFEKAKLLQSLLKNHQEDFPTLFSLNLLRLFSIANKLNIQEKELFIKEINNTPSTTKIFDLFSEGEFSIKKFLNI